MIRTILRISALNLLRDRVALALTFVLPVAFFSVFAVVFGSIDEQGARPPAVVVVAEDTSALASRIIAAMSDSPAIDLVGAEKGVTREEAGRLVRGGRAAVAVVLPAGFGAALLGAPGSAGIELWVDGAQPIAGALVSGVLHVAALDAGRGLVSAGAVGPRPAADVSADARLGQGAGIDASQTARAGVPITTVDIVGRPDKRPAIAFFAAGIGVLFLLFAVSGRSAILIEERESGVLTRLLAAKVGLGRILAGRWLFLAGLGTLQVTVMFVFAAFAFGLELFTPRHLAGFGLLTPLTAAAAASFGLLLSCACRSRAQLGGVSAVVILIMSALGGSLFPRFLMPESLQDAGRITFNAWALDGYQKVFWYEASPAALIPELSVLGAHAVLLFGLAVLVARRVRCHAA